MSLPKSTSTRKFYTRKDDEQIVSMLNEGKKVGEIASVIDHPPTSVKSRITRVLGSEKYDSLDDIKYPGDKKKD